MEVGCEGHEMDWSGPGSCPLVVFIVLVTFVCLYDLDLRMWWGMWHILGN